MRSRWARLCSGASQVRHDPTEYAIALGNHFGRWPYDHHAVLTFEKEVDAASALLEARRWIRRVEKLGCGKAWHLTSAEIGDQGRVHSHVLTLGTTGIPSVL